MTSFDSNYRNPNFSLLLIQTNCSSWQLVVPSHGSTCVYSFVSLVRLGAVHGMIISKGDIHTRGVFIETLCRARSDVTVISTANATAPKSSKFLVRSAGVVQ